MKNKVDIYDKVPIKLFGITVGHYLRFIKHGTKEVAEEMRKQKNKRFIL